MSDYKKMMDKLLNLPACTLITTGRTGSDLLQSLLDSHPEVLMFNGHSRFHLFWKQSKCVAAGDFDLKDFIDEFIGWNIHLFKSCYDTLERKDQLGEGCDQTINIDLDVYRTGVLSLMAGREKNSKNIMLACYGAYALCLGQDLCEKKLFFHHIHWFQRLNDYLGDFPASKIICMTRDPRANFVSGIENWRKFNPNTDDGIFLYNYIRRILADASVLKQLPNDYKVVRIEDLGDEALLRALCGWLGISYDECLKRSTWAGLNWHSDRLSARPNKEIGFSRNILQNKWGNKLSRLDKYVLNFIMFYRLGHYSYPVRKIGVLDKFIAPFLILFPLSYEARFFSFKYLLRRVKRREFKTLCFNVICYFRRVGLFLKYYWGVVIKKKFTEPLLKVR